MGLFCTITFTTLIGKIEMIILIPWFSLSSRLSFLFVKYCVSALMLKRWKQNLLRLWRKTRFARLSPPADYHAFGTRYSRFALMAYFSQTVLTESLTKINPDSLRIVDGLVLTFHWFWHSFLSSLSWRPYMLIPCLFKRLVLTLCYHHYH